MKQSTTPMMYLLIALVLSCGTMYGLDSAGIKDAITPKMLRFKENQKPVIMGIVGYADFSRNELLGPSSSIQVFGASVGSSIYTPLTKENTTIKKEYSGLTILVGGAKEVVHYWNNSLAGPKNAINFTQINLEHTSGYGYDVFDDTKVFLLSSDQQSWTSIRPQSFEGEKTSGNWQRIEDFSGTLRYGSTMAPGIELQSGSHFSIKGSYSWSQILPRHMFWYWAGSEIIENIGSQIVEKAVNTFGEMSISSKPIMHFVLQNAMAYGFKELRKNKMNWPFETVAPMNITSWNISLSYTF